MWWLCHWQHGHLTIFTASSGDTSARTESTRRTRKTLKIDGDGWSIIISQLCFCFFFRLIFHSLSVTWVHKGIPERDEFQKITEIKPSLKSLNIQVHIFIMYYVYVFVLINFEAAASQFHDLITRTGLQHVKQQAWIPFTLEHSSQEDLGRAH